MKFKIKFTAAALKQLKKMDKHTSSLITGWLRKNIEDCIDPRQHGKALTANHSGQWRYRIGDYRVLAEIQDKEVIVLIIEVGHRKEVY